MRPNLLVSIQPDTVQICLLRRYCMWRSQIQDQVCRVSHLNFHCTKIDRNLVRKASDNAAESQTSAGSIDCWYGADSRLTAPAIYFSTIRHEVGYLLVGRYFGDSDAAS